MKFSPDKPASIPVSIEDLWRAHMRETFNRSGGEKGAWLRHSDGIQVPEWFKENIEKLRLS
jgi:hypothetical protein